MPLGFAGGKAGFGCFSSTGCWGEPIPGEKRQHQLYLLPGRQSPLGTGAKHFLDVSGHAELLRAGILRL